MIQEQDIVVFQGRGDERLALGQSISHPDNPNMTTLDEDRDMAETADKVIAYTGNMDSQRTAMLAAFRSFYSMGYRRGYGDAMDDAVKGKDRRVKAYLN